MYLTLCRRIFTEVSQRDQLIGQLIINGDESAEALLSQPGMFPDERPPAAESPDRIAA